MENSASAGSAAAKTSQEGGIAVRLGVRRPTLPILTSLRFFAAIEVVFFHLSGAWTWERPDSFLKGLAYGGYEAVTFFFLLSGFVLTYAHAGPVERTGCDLPTTTFWRRRFARIAPAYFLGLFIALPFFLNDIERTGASAWSLTISTILVLFFLQAWWPPFATFWNIPAWSLSVEAFFYALYPWLARRTAGLPRTSLILLAYVLIVAVSVYRAGDASNQESPAGWILAFKWYSPVIHLPSFFFGVLLARLYLFGPRLSEQGHASLLVVGLSAVVLLFGFSGALPTWTRSNAVLVILFGAMIVGGAGATRVFTLLAHPVLVLLGEASYSIYILHIPVILWWKWFTRDVFGWSLSPRIDIVLPLIVIISVGLLSYRLVELPLRRLLAGNVGRTRM